MKSVPHPAAAATAALLALAGLGFGASAAAAQPLRAAAVNPAAVSVPPTPPSEELHANANSSITIDWTASTGATSYNIYRSTTSGAEGNTPIASVTGTTYTDSNLSSTPIYFYEISAVNSAGESGRTAEDASKTPPPIGTGGNTPGVASGNGELYYCKDALLGGFDWFQTLTGWFPQDLGSSGSTSPTQQVVDMAYAQAGTLTFNNVVVPTAGLYTIDWRYAFQGGLFPGVNNRQMGLKVNGVVITSTERFPITGSFDVYQHSALQAHLNAGVNSISMLAVSDHGVSRVDQLTVTPATSSVPSGPSNLAVTAGSGSAALSWTASASGSPTSYNIYRGTISDGEAVTPVGTVSGTTTTFTDTGLTSGKTYFYNVAAVNATGVSPDSNEVTVVPGSGGTVTVPAAPTGLAASAGNGSVALSWTASTGATSYSVYRGTAAGAEAATAVGTSTTNSFTDTGLTNGTKYYYVVTASNSAGTSAKSAEASATPATTGGTPPGVPFGVVITPQTGHILLQWGFESAATSYRVYRGTTPGGEGATPLVTVTSPTYTDSAVTSGVTYYYQFTALDAGGESARTAEFSATAK
ncbi:MAG TPA: fibronectin type III domain-containing protein [Actinocrinis sp.]|uniref:fibronectin type III domain-containing protein n=1 Tax=Actinocrinis sp. TaxID=1920516 RepID=UPI002DDD4335|nr:fibronectin type III domain-containing protein [Actinocrinis sp.]HEV2344385.1 fibronectin type III domain-containing protein [Actinocrinis sp.]